MRNGNTLLGGGRYRDLGTIGGGAVTGLDIADDGTLVARNDINNQHVFDPGGVNGRAFLRPGDNIPKADWIKTDIGNWDICIAPTDSQIIHSIYNGYWWKSSDRGGSVAMLPGFARNTLLNHSNDERGFGNRMRVDPADKQVVGLMDMGGLTYTLDGGATFVRHPSIPAWTLPYACIEFGRGGGLTNGRTSNVFVAVPGTGASAGIYHSSTGITGTFTLLPGSPKDVARLRWANGKLHIARDGDSAKKVMTWTAAGGFVVSTGIAYGRVLAVNPNTPAQVMAAHSGGFPGFISTTGADAFDNYSGGRDSNTDVATDVPWLAATNHNFKSANDAVWDRSANRIFVADGVGLWRIDNPDVTPPYNYVRHSCTMPVKQLISQGVRVHPTTGRLAVTHQDRAIFMFDRENAHLPALKHGVSMDPASPEIVHGGSGIDYAANDPNYWVCTHTSAGAKGTACISIDNGEEWASFLSYPSPTPAQGAVAVGNVGNILWAPTFWNPNDESGGGMYLTTNGTVNWLDCVFGGHTLVGSHGYFTNDRIPIVADKENPGTFYVILQTNGSGDAKDLALRGVWKISNNNPVAIRRRSDPIFSFGVDRGNGKLKIPPGYSGAAALFMCSGRENGYWDAPYANGLRYSKDDAVTFAPVGNIDEVGDFAFGAPAPGASFPAIYASGWVGGVYGIWTMRDFNPATGTGTWLLLSEYPGNLETFFTCLGADMQVFGRHYATGANGGVVGDYGYTLRAS